MLLLCDWMVNGTEVQLLPASACLSAHKKHGKAENRIALGLTHIHYGSTERLRTE